LRKELESIFFGNIPPIHMSTRRNESENQIATDLIKLEYAKCRLTTMILPTDFSTGQVVPEDSTTLSSNDSKEILVASSL
jgi:hypothetical protein